MKTAVLTPNGFELQDLAIPVFGDDELLVRTPATASEPGPATRLPSSQLMI